MLFMDLTGSLKNIDILGRSRDLEVPEWCLRSQFHAIEIDVTSCGLVARLQKAIKEHGSLHFFAKFHAEKIPHAVIIDAIDERHVHTLQNK